MNYEFNFKSKHLKFVEGILYFTSVTERGTLDMNKLWIRASFLNDCSELMITQSAYCRTLLSVLDKVVMESRGGSNLATLRRYARWLRNLYDWLRERNIYSLMDVRPKDIHDLLDEFSTGNWVGCLNLENRWKKAIECYHKEDVQIAFHFEGNSINCIKQEYWRKKIGWSSKIPISKPTRTALEQLISGYPKSESWYEQKNRESEPPSTAIVTAVITFLNTLSHLPTTIDQLSFRPVASPRTKARKISKRETGRTENLSLGEAASLLHHSLRLIYDVAPHVIAFLNYAKWEFHNNGKQDFGVLIEKFPKRESLLSKVQLPILGWCHSPDNPPSLQHTVIEELISAIQGACCIAIACLNARRESEICSPEKGLKLDSFHPKKKDTQIPECDFYIEKTSMRRERFYVCSVTEKAILTLENIIHGSNWKSLEIPPNASLFQSHKLTMRGSGHPQHFRFHLEANGTKSLKSFLTNSYGSLSQAPIVKSHQFRRVFGLIYYYRYENSLLKALSEHYRHSSLSMTKIYLTDPASRPLAEQISSKIIHPSSSNPRQEVATDIKQILLDVEQQKFQEIIESILNDKPVTGGFTKLIRKIYFKISSNAKFEETPSKDISLVILKTVRARGHILRPYAHGFCTAPSNPKPNARCSADGVLRPGLANPVICSGCVYSYSNLNYLHNLADILVQTKEESNNPLKTSIERKRSAWEALQLEALITKLNKLYSNEGKKSSFEGVPE
jgi:hypothetical protein